MFIKLEILRVPRFQVHPCIIKTLGIVVTQTGNLAAVKTQIFPLLVLSVADQTDVNLLNLDLGHALPEAALPPPGLDEGGPHLRCLWPPVSG